MANETYKRSTTRRYLVGMCWYRELVTFFEKICIGRYNLLLWVFFLV
jgi:hypothetical protein